MTRKRETADEADKYVGQRIRARRLEMKMSQSDVAERLGLTFQQLQKYENASNRISASKLLAVAQILKCPVSYFFEGLETEEGEQIPSRFEEELTHRDTHALLDAFTKVPKGKRQLVVSMARGLSNGQ